MLNARLVRQPSTPQGTIGRISLGPAKSWYTIELPWRDNRRQVSCIPAGEYPCSIVHSQKYGQVYHVQNVPGRSGILIHSGNLAGDTAQGFISHSKGCILPGLRVGTLDRQLAVLSSRTALREFMDALGGEPFTLIVEGGY